MQTLKLLAIGNDDFPSARLAAALVKRNRIISFGLNRKKTHPMQAKYGKNIEAIYLHAEISAIKNALNLMHSDDLIGSDLYIYRAKRLGPQDTGWHSGMSLPCVGCTKALIDFGIKKVYYSTDIDNEYGVM